MRSFLGQSRKIVSCPLIFQNISMKLFAFSFNLGLFSKEIEMFVSTVFSPHFRVFSGPYLKAQYRKWGNSLPKAALIRSDFVEFDLSNQFLLQICQLNVSMYMVRFNRSAFLVNLTKMDEEVPSAAIIIGLVFKNTIIKEKVAQKGQRNGCYNAQSKGLTMLC